MIDLENYSMMWLQYAEEFFRIPSCESHQSLQTYTVIRMGSVFLSDWKR